MPIAHSWEDAIREIDTLHKKHFSWSCPTIQSFPKLQTIHFTRMCKSSSCSLKPVDFNFHWKQLVGFNNDRSFHHLEHSTTKKGCLNHTCWMHTHLKNVDFCILYNNIEKMEGYHNMLIWIPFIEHVYIKDA